MRTVTPPATRQPVFTDGPRPDEYVDSAGILLLAAFIPEAFHKRERVTLWSFIRVYYALFVKCVSALPLGAYPNRT